MKSHYSISDGSFPLIFIERTHQCIILITFISSFMCRLLPSRLILPRFSSHLQFVHDQRKKSPCRVELINIGGKLQFSCCGSQGLVLPMIIFLCYPCLSNQACGETHFYVWTYEATLFFNVHWIIQSKSSIHVGPFSFSFSPCRLIGWGRVKRGVKLDGTSSGGPSGDFSASEDV